MFSVTNLLQWFVLHFFKLSVGWLMWSSSTWPLVQLLSASMADGFPSRWVLAHSTTECCQTGWTKSNTFGKVLQNCQAPLGLFRLEGQSLSFGTAQRFCASIRPTPRWSNWIHNLWRSSVILKLPSKTHRLSNTTFFTYIFNFHFLTLNSLN